MDATADYTGEQYSSSTFTSASGNFTRIYREGGAGGKGVTYMMMSIGLDIGLYGVRLAETRSIQWSEFNWEGLLEGTYYNCE